MKNNEKNKLFGQNRKERQWIKNCKEHLNLSGKFNSTHAMGEKPSVEAIDAVPKKALKCFEDHASGIIPLHITRTAREVDLLFIERMDSSDLDSWECEYDNQRFISWKARDKTLKKVQAIRYYVDLDDYEIGAITVRSYGVDRLVLVDQIDGYDPF